MSIWQGFWLALSFLTRLPSIQFKQHNLQAVKKSLWFYPLIGLFIGAILAVILQLILLSHTPNEASINLVAALILLCWVSLTGGLHIDGLADSADGWVGGQQDKARTLSIMQDPHIGVMGMLAVALLLLVKFSALSALIQSFSSLSISLLLLATPMLARMSMLILLASLPYVRANGLGSELKQGASSFLVLTSLAWVIILAFILLQTQFFIALGFAVAWGVLSYLMLKQRLGGTTGDVLGAHLEIQEALLLVAFVLA